MEGDGAEVEEILVVDDNPADRRFIEEAFRESAFDPTLHTTSTRDEALTFLTRCRDEDESPNPVLVLLDWNLSQTTGAEVLDTATSGDRSIPVIVMTGGPTETTALEPNLEKADLVIEKPTDPAEYIDAVRSVLTDP